LTLFWFVAFRSDLLHALVWIHTSYDTHVSSSSHMYPPPHTGVTFYMLLCGYTHHMAHMYPPPHTGVTFYMLLCGYMPFPSPPNQSLRERCVQLLKPVHFDAKVRHTHFLSLSLALSLSLSHTHTHTVLKLNEQRRHNATKTHTTLFFYFILLVLVLNEQRRHGLSEALPRPRADGSHTRLCRPRPFLDPTPWKRRRWRW